MYDNKHQPKGDKTMTPTTRKFPRTLKEAFPSHENACAIEIYPAKTTMADKVMRVVFLVALIVLVLDLFIWRP
jgi:hypothetical protein